MTNQANADAIKDLLVTALAPVPPRGCDEVDAPREGDYAEYSVTRLDGSPERRSSGQKALTGYLVTVKAIAMSVENARLILENAHAGLDCKRVVVGGVTSGLIVFDDQDEILPDGEKYSGESTYIYAIRA